jgi:hypothetical protein
MPKGWTVQITTQDVRSWRPIVRHRRFAVAIEDRDRAVEAVRHHVRADATADIVAIGELPSSYGLSPGRIRAR